MFPMRWTRGGACGTPLKRRARKPRQPQPIWRLSRLSFHAELAFDYFELRSAEAEQRLLDDTVLTFQKALDLTQNRFDGGVAAGAEVAQAKTQLEATKTQDTDVAVRRAPV